MNRPGFFGDSISWEIMESWEDRSCIRRRFRWRAVGLVSEHRGEHRSEWAAICLIAEKFGCAAETLRKWVRQAERDLGTRPGLTSDQLAELRELRRENRELRRANEILRKASAYFAQAEVFDRRPRR